MTTLEQMQRLVEAGCEFKVGGYKGTASGAIMWVGHIQRDGDPQSRMVTLATGPGSLLDALVGHASNDNRYADLFTEAPSLDLSEKAS